MTDVNSTWNLVHAFIIHHSLGNAVHQQRITMNPKQLSAGKVSDDVDAQRRERKIPALEGWIVFPSNHIFSLNVLGLHNLAYISQ